MIQDLHSHTYYSFCGGDTPDAIVEAAIVGGIDVFGITDHLYGVVYGTLGVFLGAEAAVRGGGDIPATRENYDRALHRYFDHMDLVREKYKNNIRILRGIEVCTLQGDGFCVHHLPDGVDISYYDYCLIENLDAPNTVTGGDLFAYAKRCATPYVGVAHTDLFAHIAECGAKPLDYFRRMADEGIFWEMNVSYDSIHNYREHAYVLDFFSDPRKQEIVRESGVRVSVGFDGHRVADYRPDRVADYCRRLTAMGIKMPFEA